MPTEILRPDAPGAECNIISEAGCSVCPNHYDCVYEEDADELTTVIADLHQTDYHRDLYNVEDSAGEGVINFIKVWVRVKASVIQEQANFKICIQTGGIPYESEGVAASTSFTDYSEQWINNPGGGAWTWAQIDALQAGVALRSCHSSGAFDTQCTQVWVEVDYTLPPIINPLISKPLVSRVIIGRTRIR